MQREKNPIEQKPKKRQLKPCPKFLIEPGRKRFVYSPQNRPNFKAKNSFLLKIKSIQKLENALNSSIVFKFMDFFYILLLSFKHY